MRMWLMYLLEMCKDTECSREGGGGECVGELSPADDKRGRMRLVIALRI